MRLPTLSLLLISAVLFGEMHAASAQSPTSYPWCSRSGRSSTNNCYFTSKEQCQRTTKPAPPVTRIVFMGFPARCGSSFVVPKKARTPCWLQIGRACAK